LLIEKEDHSLKKDGVNWPMMTFAARHAQVVSDDQVPPLAMGEFISKQGVLPFIYNAGRSHNLFVVTHALP
jgi:hypothetical protein